MQFIPLSSPSAAPAKRALLELAELRPDLARFVASGQTVLVDGAREYRFTPAGRVATRMLSASTPRDQAPDDDDDAADDDDEEPRPPIVPESWSGRSAELTAPPPRRRGLVLEDARRAAAGLPAVERERVTVRGRPRIAAGPPRRPKALLSSMRAASDAPGAAPRFRGSALLGAALRGSP